MDGVKPFAGVKVMMTGATGFLGQTVLPLLASLGAQPWPAARGTFDLRDRAQTLASMMVLRPDVVVHMAAPRETAPLVEILRDTILMGLNVLEACALGGAKAVFVSRTGLPGSPERTVQEALLQTGKGYRRECGLRFIQLLPCDLYGPLDHYGKDRRRLLPWLTAGILEAKKAKLENLRLPGDGAATLPLLHVEDAARAVAAACAIPGCDMPLEISAEPVALEWISDVVAEHIGFEGEIEWDGKEGAWRARTADGAAAREILDWNPTVDHEKGIETTVQEALPLLESLK